MATVPGTVRIGGMTQAELLAELQRKGVQLNEIARALLAHPDLSLSHATSSVSIENTSVGELGYTQGATIGEVVASAIARGLTLCPLELAPHLRLQFMDQPEGYWGHPLSEHRAPPGSITVASRPLIAQDGAPMGFYLRRIRGVPWLRGYRSAAEHIWSADDRFIFCRAGEPAP